MVESTIRYSKSFARSLEPMAFAGLPSDIAVKIRREESGLPEQVERAARGVLGDLSLVKRFQYVEELDHELDKYEQADASWRSTNVAQTVFADLTLQRSLAVNEAGDLVSAGRSGGRTPSRHPIQAR